MSFLGWLGWGLVAVLSLVLYCILAIIAEGMRR